MRRNSPYVVVALAAAVVGGIVALLVGALSGLTDKRTSTVYVPTSASDLVVGRDEAISHARPLAGNRFDPARIYAARSPGVVTIFSLFDKPDEHEAQGSGFIASSAGYILTSAHVVIDTSTSKTIEAKNVYVGFKDRDRVQATLVGWDVYDDVALLKVDPSAHALASVPLGDSSRVRAGDPVAAMGSPFGNEDSISTGVVSAIRRSIASLTSVYKVVDAIQIDAPITHGNSGGPLFDARGRVVGINAQIRTETGGAEGVGFAIPINAARRSMTQLAATGRVVYAYLGVTTEDLTPSLARHFGYGAARGALVGEVREDGPAEKAGMHGGSGDATFNGQSITPGGDIIVAIDGRAVQSADDVVREVSTRLPGQTISLTVVRGRARKVLHAKLGARPDAPETNP
ncbi:MAG TPA: trypsin-like peptidase domain-containing protein [Gaiellaceae bacterium]